MGIPIIWFELHPGDARSLVARPEPMGELIDIAVEVADAHGGREDGERFPDSPTDAVLRAAVRSARQGPWKSMMRLAELAARGKSPAHSHLPSSPLLAPPELAVRPGTAAFCRSQERRRLPRESTRDFHHGLLDPDPDYADRFARLIEGDISVVRASPGTRGINRYSQAHLLAALEFLHEGELRDFLSQAASRRGWVFSAYP